MAAVNISSIEVVTLSSDDGNVTAVPALSVSPVISGKKMRQQRWNQKRRARRREKRRQQQDEQSKHLAQKGNAIDGNQSFLGSSASLIDLTGEDGRGNLNPAAMNCDSQSAPGSTREMASFGDMPHGKVVEVAEAMLERNEGRERTPLNESNSSAESVTASRMSISTGPSPSPNALGTLNQGSCAVSSTSSLMSISTGSSPSPKGVDESKQRNQSARIFSASADKNDSSSRQEKLVLKAPIASMEDTNFNFQTTEAKDYFSVRKNPQFHNLVHSGNQGLLRDASDGSISMDTGVSTASSAATTESMDMSLSSEDFSRATEKPEELEELHEKRSDFNLVEHLQTDKADSLITGCQSPEDYSESNLDPTMDVKTEHVSENPGQPSGESANIPSKIVQVKDRSLSQAATTPSNTGNSTSTTQWIPLMRRNRTGIELVKERYGMKDAEVGSARRSSTTQTGGLTSPEQPLSKRNYSGSSVGSLGPHSNACNAATGATSPLLRNVFVKEKPSNSVLSPKRDKVSVGSYDQPSPHSVAKKRPKQNTNISAKGPAGNSASSPTTQNSDNAPCLHPSMPKSKRAQTSIESHDRLMTLRRASSSKDAGSRLRDKELEDLKAIIEQQKETIAELRRSLAAERLEHAQTRQSLRELQEDVGAVRQSRKESDKGNEVRVHDAKLTTSQSQLLGKTCRGRVLTRPSRLEVQITRKSTSESSESLGLSSRITTPEVPEVGKSLPHDEFTRAEKDALKKLKFTVQNPLPAVYAQFYEGTQDTSNDPPVVGTHPNHYHRKLYQRIVIDRKRLSKLHLHRETDNIAARTANQLSALRVAFSDDEEYELEAELLQLKEEDEEEKRKEFEAFMGVPKNMVPVVKDAALGFRAGVLNQRTRRLDRTCPTFKVGRDVPGELRRV